MLIWIGKHRREDNGAIDERVCERCHNRVAYHLIRSYRMVSFNFIPLFAVGSKWRLECPICAHGRELASNEVETHKRAALRAAAYADANKEEDEALVPVRQSEADTAGNNAGGRKPRVRISAVVLAAIVVAAIVSVALIASKNAPLSSVQSAPANAPKAATPLAPLRTAVRARPHRSGRTPPRAASAAASPHADSAR